MSQCFVPTWARELTEEVLGAAPFRVGDEIRHPDGRLVRVIAGQYWGQYGLSNHWSWQEIGPDGQVGPTESGYGWQPARD